MPDYSGQRGAEYGISAVISLLHHDGRNGLVAAGDTSSGDRQLGYGSLVTLTCGFQRLTAHDFAIHDEGDDEVAVVSVGGRLLAHPDDLGGGGTT